MKNQAIQYLAFDVRQATTVATVRDEHGAILLRATVPTEPPLTIAFIEFSAAADQVPFVGPALPRLAFRRFTRQFDRHVKAARA